MTNLIKMEWYKLRTTKMFIILAVITALINLAFSVGVPMILTAFCNTQAATGIADATASPFGFSLLMIPMYISAIGFLYSDFAGGFIKNYAGQVGTRDKIVAAKFIVLGIHNLVFFILGSLTNILGLAMAGTLTFNGNIGAGIGTLLLKWLLSMAICSILMFFAVGIKNKTFATIIGVIFATGALNLMYMGINMGIANIFKVQEFDIGHFLPDSLMNSVNIMTGTLIVNSIVVALVFIAVFMILTHMTFKKRDIK